MHKGMLVACVMLAVTTANADPEPKSANDPPASREEFYSAAREAGLFEAVDQNSDGVIDRKEFGEARLPEDWNAWAGGKEQLGADEFYQRAFDAYGKAAHAVRAFPAP